MPDTTTDVEDARADLTPIHRLLLDLAGFVSRYENVVGVKTSTKQAYAECAAEVEKIARQYLAPDGTVLPGPLVLVEIEDGTCDVGTYHYPVEVIVIDWDAVADDGEYTEERKEEVRNSTLPALDKSGVFERLNSL